MAHGVLFVEAAPARESLDRDARAHLRTSEGTRARERARTARVFYSPVASNAITNSRLPSVVRGGIGTHGAYGKPQHAARSTQGSRDAVVAVIAAMVVIGPLREGRPARTGVMASRRGHAPGKQLIETTSRQSGSLPSAFGGGTRKLAGAGGRPHCRDGGCCMGDEEGQEQTFSRYSRRSDLTALGLTSYKNTLVLQPAEASRAHRVGTAESSSWTFSKRKTAGGHPTSPVEGCKMIDGSCKPRPKHVTSLPRRTTSKQDEEDGGRRGEKRRETESQSGTGRRIVGTMSFCH